LSHARPVLHTISLVLVGSHARHENTRSAMREVKIINRFVAGAAPSPVNAKKRCVQPRDSISLHGTYILMNLVAGGTDSCGRDDCGRHQGRHPRRRKGLSDAWATTVECRCHPRAHHVAHHVAHRSIISRNEVSSPTSRKSPMLGRESKRRTSRLRGSTTHRCAFGILARSPCFLGPATAWLHLLAGIPE
jgi:hypothetical protein